VRSPSTAVRLARPLWTPHITLAYSNSVRPAAPVISALGQELPPREVTINGIALVDQRGPEDEWDWHPIAEVALGTARTGGPPTP
jgi:2'-5' RNA ligase